MPSARRARILLVAGSAHGRVLLDRLGRMELAEITVVDELAEARRLCAAGAADVCILVAQETRPDEVLPLSADAAAPGRDCGVPSVLLAHVVTPYVKRAARKSGYIRAVPAAATPQFLYRSIRAALQRARQTRGLKVSVKSAARLKKQRTRHETSAASAARKDKLH